MEKSEININEIHIVKAKVHNLKSISLKIPKNSLTVITGPSGSGKSSLAFDTIYVEGQRRYIESLSSYARQFLGQYHPADVESISGLSPSIAIDQKTSSKNPRSTVGTTTEIFDYMRVLFARIGTLHDLHTGEPLKKHTVPSIGREILKFQEKTRIQILSPMKIQSNLPIKEQFSKFLSMGFSRFRINQDIVEVDDQYKFPKKISSSEVVIDRLIIKSDIQKRLHDSIELALKHSGGDVWFLAETAADEKSKGKISLLKFSEHMKSPKTEEVYPELEPRLFSFNSPLGACSHCNGLGESKTFDQDLILGDDELPILEGAIKPLTKRSTFLYKMVECMADAENVDIRVPFKKIPKKFKELLFNGSEKVYKYSFTSENSHFEFSKPFPGLISWLEKKFVESQSEKVRVELESYMNIKTCPMCHGHRLNPVALSTRIQNKNIMDLCSLSIEDCLQFMSSLSLTGEEKIIAEKLLKEIVSRLRFLKDVGLNYLSLSRASMTLSGGESQRIRLATQIGSALSGVLYVLDEPSIGLHQRDNDRLIATLKSLRDLGNTVLVVEHDEDTMMQSDYLIDIGPGAGIHGGEVVAIGPTKDIIKAGKGITAKYLSKKEIIPLPEKRRMAKSFLHLLKANEHNLKNVDLKIPLQALTSVTGVSGSGKSTLIHRVLVPALKARLVKNSEDEIIYKKNNYQTLKNFEDIKSIIELDQSPIGRTPHSNPATYSGLFDEVRELFSSTPESQIRGYRPGRFSFNVKGGRCEDCEGNGVKKIEMHFLPDVYITCSECKGTRFNNETLSVLYKGKNISEILDLSILEAHEFFKNHPKIARILHTLNSVGLGYMKLGQPATTLSGGEAQRLKLSKELAKRTKGHCLYVLDEPTTGLHFEDIKILLKALNLLVDQGHTMIVIEHNLDVIKTSDWIIDLGPEGGSGGGEIIAEGTPETVSKNKHSHTGRYLKKIL